MRSPTKDITLSPKSIDKDGLSNLKHDINNQLSNILLAIEQLRYEIPGASEDCIFYLDSISNSAANINALLKATE
ncbi:MAG: hypothetical protein JWQ84_1775 [Mucilaginibacter sp.]|nr:hypothetical protein [Mucilaginibacter sp.]MDB5016943.1 hypothetical protein [Mucilaginibacter sp.]